MAEKLSKTARASLGKKKVDVVVCPVCLIGLVATLVLKTKNSPGGMYWVCKCGYRRRTKRG